MKNNLDILFDRLREEGWYCGWGLACCQSCAWDDVPFEHEVGPFKGKDIDFDKCLFNHEQDCEIDVFELDENAEECEVCYGDDENCPHCKGTGWIVDESVLEELDIVNRKYSAYPHYTHYEQTNSTFCFNGDKEGVKNLKAILPIIEECGIEWHWNQKGNSRIDLDWSEITDANQ
jgi:hypothetical protein